MDNNNKIVSFEDEPLILVDENDNEIGYLTKDLCHKGMGILHRAFSIFLFNDKMDLVLQRRSSDKLLWGDYWSNTVCSHPRKGETLEIATKRRLEDELGITAELTHLFKFQYQAKFKNLGSEHELCHVFIGRHNGLYFPNPNEIKDLMLIPFDEVEVELKRNEKLYTPWFKMEWASIIKDYKKEIHNLFK
ncbi:MAG: isopentenyl-diphosphate delta-isomerase [Ignavibacteria bacterium GWF2_33_9]|nr:MAG: isopentenyl-diphosphate delta-isomerase [Ignavibacteria bacterium GWF2_33_9]